MKLRFNQEFIFYSNFVFVLKAIYEFWQWSNQFGSTLEAGAGTNHKPPV